MSKLNVSRSPDRIVLHFPMDKLTLVISIFLIAPASLLFIDISTAALGVVAVLVLLLIGVLANRDEKFIIDRAPAQLIHEQDGIFRSPLMAYRAKKILLRPERVEIQRHVARYQDTYGLVIRLMSSEAVPVTNIKLGFSQAHELAAELTAFLNLPKPPRPID